MSQMTLKIVAQVVDNASKPLESIERRLRSITAAAQTAALAMGKLGGIPAVVIGTTGPKKDPYSYYRDLARKGNLAAQKAVDPLLTQSPKGPAVASMKAGLGAAEGLKSIAGLSPKADQGLKAVKKTIQESEADLTKFNRTLFAATAFVGTFYGAFRAGSKAVEEGARFDRLITQFERVVGPQGEFLSALREFTDSSVDQMEAFRSGIALNMLGIKSGVKDTAQLIAMSSVAAKNAGLESGEGIRAVTEFVKSSNIALLKNLNLVRENDPGLKLLTATISKYTGVAGGAVNAQERMSIALTALRRSTAGTMKGFRDLLDTILDLKQNAGGAFNEFGITIGKAIQPFLESVVDFVQGIRPVIRHLRETDAGFLFLIKSIIGVTSALAAAITVFGAFKLSVKALGALGFGIPFLTKSLGFLALAFGMVTRGVKFNKEAFEKARTPGEKLVVLFEYFGKKLQLFGAFLRGTAEALTSFFKPENYSRGIGVISGEVSDLLEKYGLLTTTIDESGKRIATGGSFLNFAKAIGTVASFIRGAIEGVRAFAEGVTEVFDTVAKSINKVFGTKIGTPTLGSHETFRSAGKILAGSFLASIALSKIKLISGLFGLGSLGKKKEGPSGNPGDPIYVRDTVGLVKSVTGAGEGASGGGFLSGIGKLLHGLFIAPLIKLKANIEIFFELAKGLGTVKDAFYLLRPAIEGAAKQFVYFKLAFDAISGFVSGLGQSNLNFGELWDSIKLWTGDLGKTLSTAFEDYIITPIKKIGDYIDSIINKMIDKLPDWAKSTGEFVRDASKAVASSIGYILTFEGSEDVGKLISVLTETAANNIQSASSARVTEAGGEYAKTALATGKATMPDVGDSGTNDYLMGIYSQLQNANREDIAGSIFKGVSAAQKEGKDTPEKEREIIYAAFRAALDKSTNLTNIKDNTKTKTKPDNSNRGGCG